MSSFRFMELLQVLFTPFWHSFAKMKKFFHSCIHKPSIHSSIYPFIHPFTDLLFNSFTYPSIHSSFYLFISFTQLSIHSFTYQPLQDVLLFHQFNCCVYMLVDIWVVDVKFTFIHFCSAASCVDESFMKISKRVEDVSVTHDKKKNC